MAAESAPRDRMPNAMAWFRRRSAFGPAVGPVIGGALAGLVGLRARSVARLLLRNASSSSCEYDDARFTRGRPDAAETGRVSFRNVLAFQNFILMMGVIFGLQFVDRSFGPCCRSGSKQSGVAHARVPLVSGVLFSIMR